ncbi:MAG: hypothetical protein LPJ89_04180 [Hymenobacteraceae bacterium]|nr:hypothetical protein [Hymenobacteraceae bacterium]MDX5396697.1 hypothetical protein [Hymenobacteraceae bacterium]MDX5442962.1 hypothetical protein [Hymenobacteraceae bacterium]MDX5512757.1 hypothetical protein [Hymenobacteraceae bacterium]
MLTKLKYYSLIGAIICLVAVSGCSNRIPCPKITGKSKKFKTPEQQAKSGGVTAVHDVKYDNKGIMKKKKYKKLRYKPKKINKPNR